MQAQKVDTIIEHLPSEEHCKFVTISNGLVAARQTKQEPLQKSIDFLRQMSTGRFNNIIDDNEFHRAQVENALCPYVGRDEVGGSVNSICNGIPQQTARHDLGSVGTVNNLSDDDVSVITTGLQLSLIHI